MYRSIRLMVVILITALGQLQAEEESQPEQPAEQSPWEVEHSEEFSVAVPRGWRRFPLPAASRPLHLIGDGIGLPALDDTEQPLQAGFMVERFAATEEPAATGAKENLNGLKTSPLFEILGEPTVQEVKLSDGTPAALLTVEFLRKDKNRKSHFMKLFAKDQNSVGWVVTAFLVAGKDSQFATKHPEIPRRLKAQVLSFCFDKAKFSDAGVKAAHEPEKPKQD